MICFKLSKSLARVFGAFVMVWVFPSCQFIQAPAMRGDEALSLEKRLEEDLIELPHREPQSRLAQRGREAKKVARRVAEFTQEFRLQNRPVRFPWLNNALVHLMDDRYGLCWHHQIALYQALCQLQLRCYHMDLVVSKQGSLLEHHALLIRSAHSQPSKGLVIDTWVNPGRFVFYRLEEKTNHWHLNPSWQRLVRSGERGLPSL